MIKIPFINKDEFSISLYIIYILCMSYYLYSESDGKSIFTNIPTQLLFLMQATFRNLVYCCG